MPWKQDGDANKALFRRFVQVWESGDLDALEAILHPSYAGHPTAGDRDADGLRRRITAFRETFRDPHFALHDQLAEGDRVASRMTLHARTADGQRVVLFGHNISRFAEGLLAEEWMAWEPVPAQLAAESPGASGTSGGRNTRRR